MKIIDTTTYFEEKLMMDIRFNILDKFVDHFIVCESRFSHSGIKKNINFNINDYPLFKNKISHLILEEEPLDIIKNLKNDYDVRLNSIKRIAAQRNYIKKYLKNFSEEDYIIYSDNDEIPNLNNFVFSENSKKIILFKQKLFYYKFNLSIPNVPWFGSKACRVKDLKSIDWLRNIKNKVYNPLRPDILFSNKKYSNIKIVDNGGWHFSNLKTIEELERKYLNDENHSEYEKLNHSVEKIKRNLENKVIDYNHSAKKDSSERFNSSKLVKVENSSLPEYLIINKNKHLKWFD
jgi:beta-1,4-mannosyl-glycoprotein beta-1,4-N-acetylglucosaminyltransferase